MITSTMVRSRRFGVPLAALCVLAGSAASARAADPVIANDGAQEIDALNGNLLYRHQPGGKYACMRRVGGKLLRVTRIAATYCGAGELGLDRKGRVVYPFFHVIKHGGRVSSLRWYLYDLTSELARPVRGLPGGSCFIGDVHIWRKRMVYVAARCASKKRSGLWVKEGKKTRRITTSTDAILELTLRGGALAALAYTGPLDDSEGIVQLMVGGKPCVRLVKTSVAPGDHDWAPSGVWIANGHIVWSMGNNEYSVLPPLALLASKLPSRCAPPGPTGRFDFTPETTTFSTLAVDGREVYYADNRSIRGHTLPAQPSHAPPANDDFENAQSVTVDPQVYMPGSTAWATRQRDEPLASSKQTVWYTFTPAASRTVHVTAYRDMRAGRFAVYTGTSRGALTLVAGPSPMSGAYLQFDAVAGQKYLIDVGTSDAEPDYVPLGVSVTTTRPSG